MKTIPEAIRLMSSKVIIYPLGAIANNTHPRVQLQPGSRAQCKTLAIRGQTWPWVQRLASTHKLAQSAITKTTTNTHTSAVTHHNPLSGSMWTADLHSLTLTATVWDQVFFWQSLSTDIQSNMRWGHQHLCFSTFGSLIMLHCKQGELFQDNSSANGQRTEVAFGYNRMRSGSFQWKWASGKGWIIT